ncbi:HD-GYP domain-containing protein [Gracilibacillus marinus]|uniref:HD-GYP domain-containing protein n=1 Tax=Gracilibacillus marinus TaxID=630535 RepID=A0ABV8VRZ0_9BACI
MNNLKNRSSLATEKKRTTIWFMWLFFVTFFFYDILYASIMSYITANYDILMHRSAFNFLIYSAIFLLIPISYYLFKRNKDYRIKYILFISYTIVNMLSEYLHYSNSTEIYASGNVLEIVMILFAPIFVNLRFYLTVSLGTILKYLMIGFMLEEPIVILPLIITVVVSLVGSIILFRFIAYVKAVENSYDEQLEGIVRGIVTTLELKDKYTRGHSERVASYALILAESLDKFKQNELNAFYNVCLLHDVGKVSIPDEILLKKSKLTEQEYDIIKQHPVIGAEAIKNVEGLTNYIEVIRHHHERWDGNGYPDQLKGEQISLFARITAIADAFDAMTSSRSYRAALPLEVAKSRIIEEKGTQFDAELVDKFEEVYPQWVAFHNNYHKNRGEINENS